MAKRFYIGVDVGGTKISAALVDHRGKIMVWEKVPTLQTKKTFLIGRQIEKIIKNILTESKLGTQSIRGIGLGIPGIVDPHSNKILVTPNIRLAGYPLAHRLRKVFRTKIALGNDVNCGTLAEKWLGAGRKAQNVVGVFLGTGVGGGIVIDGKIYTGAKGIAGELGHMIIDLHSSESSAGLFGTLEALTSRRAIERQIRRAVKKGKRTIIKDLAGNNLKQIKSKSLLKAIQKRDPVVLEIMNNVCFILGKACISLRHIFNPDLIILGGGVMEACGDYILPRVQKISEKNPFLSGIDRCEIVKSKLGDEAVILGAVAMVREMR